MPGFVTIPEFRCVACESESDTIKTWVEPKAPKVKSGDTITLDIDHIQTRDTMPGVAMVKVWSNGQDVTKYFSSGWIEGPDGNPINTYELKPGHTITINTSGAHGATIVKVKDPKTPKTDFFDWSRLKIMAFVLLFCLLPLVMVVIAIFRE